MGKMEKYLTRIMNNIADFVGIPQVFIGAIALVVLWFVLSVFMDYDVWFDVMDVTIFLASFLMLFILQASQNADTKAMQDKLDKIIDALPQADDSAKGEEEEFKKGRRSPN